MRIPVLYNSYCVKIEYLLFSTISTSFIFKLKISYLCTKTGVTVVCSLRCIATRKDNLMNALLFFHFNFTCIVLVAALAACKQVSKQGSTGSRSVCIQALGTVVTVARLACMPARLRIWFNRLQQLLGTSAERNPSLRAQGRWLPVRVPAPTYLVNLYRNSFLVDSFGSCTWIICSLRFPRFGCFHLTTVMLSLLIYKLFMLCRLL